MNPRPMHPEGDPVHVGFHASTSPRPHRVCRRIGRGLRADGVRAEVFREQKDATTGWVTAPVAENTATDLENTILMRARQLRISQFGE